MFLVVGYFFFLLHPFCLAGSILFCSRKVGEEWYKHLGMMEPDRVKENDMNDTLKYEYLRTLKLIMILN